MATERVEKVLPPPIAAFDDLLCGCGNPEDVWALLERYLRMLHDRTSGSGRFGEWPGGESDDAPGDSPALWAFLAYVVDHLNLTEHGTSIGGAWLTDHGREALSFLEEYGVAWKDDPASWWVDASGTVRSAVG